MHPVHAGLDQAFEFFCRADIGGDHEFLDQPMGIEPRTRHHRAHAPFFIQQHAAFRQVQIKRTACFACGQQGTEGAVKACHMASGQAFWFLASFKTRLRLFVCQPRGGTHDAAPEAMPGLSPRAIKVHFHEKAAAIFARAQAAPAIGKGLGQHGHDAIGEIDRIAARPGFAVQMAIRADIMRHIGNGDRHFPAGAIGFGMDGIIEIACVIAINRHQRQVAQINPPACRHAMRRFGLADRLGRKNIGDAMGMDADE